MNVNPQFFAEQQAFTFKPSICDVGLRGQYSSSFPEALTGYKPLIVCHICDYMYYVFPDNRHILHKSLHQ